MDENGNPVEGGSDGKYTYRGDHLNKDVFAQNKYIYNRNVPLFSIKFAFEFFFHNKLSYPF